MPPAATLSVVESNLKTVSSRLLRKRWLAVVCWHYPESVLWGRSYFVASSGGSPLDVIKRYIEVRSLLT